ncbi:unnamed protein product, partial [Urochloa humidicola]
GVLRHPGCKDPSPHGRTRSVWALASRKVTCKAASKKMLFASLSKLLARGGKTKTFMPRRQSPTMVTRTGRAAKTESMAH